MELNKTQRYLDNHSVEQEQTNGDLFEVLSYYDTKTATKLAVYEYIQRLQECIPSHDLIKVLEEDKKFIESQYKKVIEKWM
ncbi:hypothetical protein [Leptolyngbya phage Lbo-JY46]